MRGSERARYRSAPDSIDEQPMDRDPLYRSLLRPDRIVSYHITAQHTTPQHTTAHHIMPIWLWLWWQLQYIQGCAVLCMQDYCALAGWLADGRPTVLYSMIGRSVRWMLDRGARHSYSKMALHGSRGGATTGQAQQAQTQIRGSHSEGRSRAGILGNGRWGLVRGSEKGGGLCSGVLEWNGG